MSLSRPTRALAAVLVSAVLLTTAACATDTVSRGERPNQPTSTVIPEPDPETDPTALWLDPITLPAYTPPSSLGEGRFERPMVGDAGEVSWQVVDAEGAVIPEYEASQKVAFGDAETYTEVPGVLTFRGNHWRTGGAYGAAEITDKKLEVVWSKPIPEIRGEGSYWPGAGWTGQPLLVQWPDEVRAALGLGAEFDKPGFVEVIYPVFGGKIYRLDLATGAETRDPIQVGWGFKGTASVDPRGYPLLYAGQGLNDTDGTIGPWRYRIFDLIQNKEVWHLHGLDPDAPRSDWGAFDSSALVNRHTDTLFEPAENGLIYKIKLNAEFDADAKSVSIDPDVVKLRYQTSLSDTFGIESSAAAYRNLMFAADNDGNLICWDATSLEILWATELGDDTDSTVVIDETPDGVFLYTGNEVDERAKTGGERIANFRKIDALTGRQLWQYDVPAYYAGINGGILATPIVGRGDLADLVIVNISRTTAPREGDLVALDKDSGEVVWRRHLSNYSWSSPTIVTATDGTQYGILADSAGTMHLFDPHTGEDISTVNLGKNVEASPAVFENMIVVASYDKHIYGIRIS